MSVSNHRCEGAAWLSSARAVRCRLKCHNERNPYLQLLTGYAEDSGETAVVRCEEGGDDVKSARPLRPGLHTCYNGGYSGHAAERAQHHARRKTRMRFELLGNDRKQCRGDPRPGLAVARENQWVRILKQ